jgi:NTP pyrophosphatase (non-canonical NTP hydrolase)
MNFNEYQAISKKTAVYPDIGNNLIYVVLGLCGEVGEVAEKVKKNIRDHGGVFDAQRKGELVKEVGDVLWYISQIAAELGVPLEDVVQANIEKLESRKQRNTLHGGGDNR